MACDRCVPAMRTVKVVGAPVECRCDYCGEKFVAGKPNQCLECDYYCSVKTDEGYRYHCLNDFAESSENGCSGFQKEGCRKPRHNPDKLQNKYGSKCQYAEDDGKGQISCENSFIADTSICKGNRHNCVKIKYKKLACRSDKQKIEDGKEG